MIGACRSVSGPAAVWRDGALWVSNGDESWCEPGSEPAGWTSGPDRDRTSSRRESSEDIGQGPSAQHRAGIRSHVRPSSWLPIGQVYNIDSCPASDTEHHRHHIETKEISFLLVPSGFGAKIGGGEPVRLAPRTTFGANEFTKGNMGNVEL